MTWHYIAPHFLESKMGQKRTTEEQVASSVLQQKDQTIEIGGREYRFGKPSVATIIMVSGLISKLPEVNTDITDGELTEEVLKTARHSKVLGEIVATLILGAKRVMAIRESKRHWWQRKDSEYDRLSRDVLLECDAKELSKLVIDNLTNLHLGNFFAITASLAGANATKPTKDGAED